MSNKNSELIFDLLIVLLAFILFTFFIFTAVKLTAHLVNIQMIEESEI